ncbi:isochorismate synthase [Celerinatantimonas yamalensis]|uniref:isochorismate synthase n=1 Tax=Celerinatantimonas yamalensis TaxID=559956 RepID=A0ABW9GAS3_9GAMM
MWVIDPKQLEQAIHDLCDTSVTTWRPLKIRVQVDSELAWLAAQPNPYKGYWRDRNAQQVCYLGKMAELTDLDDLVVLEQRYPAARFYGGIAFDSSREQWPGFAPCQFVLPEIELRSTGNEYWLYLNNWQQLSADERRQLLAQVFSTPPPLRWQACEFTLAQYHPTLERWHALIAQCTHPSVLGDLPKVVFARQSCYQSTTAFSALALFDIWQQQQPDNFAFFISSEANNSFFGVPPERLYLRCGQSLESEALAGSCAASDDPITNQQLADELQLDRKNIHENQLVVDAIHAALAPLCESIHIAPTRVLKQRHVQHLCQPIQAILHPETNDKTLLQALHPTPAVAGFPIASAQRYIGCNESFERGWYAGAVGYLSAEQSEMSVAIRSAYQHHQQLTLFAGAGIVQGSNAESEWQELNQKIATIQGLLDDHH